MGKKISALLLVLGMLSCGKKQVNCRPEFHVTLHPAFAVWAEPYSPDSTCYMRYRSSKGAEESLEITRDKYFSEWYLQDYTECYNGHGEWRDFRMKSTIYDKNFDVGILQYTLQVTELYLVNRTYGMEEISVWFEENREPYIRRTPCDTCVKIERNVLVNGKPCAEIIRYYSPLSVAGGRPESVKEMIYARGFGLIQYTCNDSTVWNAVY